MKSVLLVSCPDQKGIIYAVTESILKAGGNILELEQHVDDEDKQFFMRVEWTGGDLDFPKRFEPVAERFLMWTSYVSGQSKPKLALMVSKMGHCLVDTLIRVESGQLPTEVSVVISNHPDLKSLTERYGVRFEHFAIDDKNREEQEKNMLDLMRELRIDFIGLARYMKILGPEFVREYHNRVINVHHSFLPAFVGAKPYHKAYERGVKIIGATSHYVTEQLDEGPIIEQAVRRVGHKFDVNDLVEIGREIEREVFFVALKKHVERKIIVHKNRTIIFH